MTIRETPGAAGLKAALDYALEFQKWAKQQLVDAQEKNLASVLANREKQYIQACDDAEAAREAYDNAASEARGIG